jgi:DNA-binding MarR family transcriptional regulator
MKTMKPDDSGIVLGRDLDFLRELWALDHALQKLSKRMERTLGVSGPQRLALRLVARFPGLPAGRLARMMSLHPSTVSGLVRRLADRGFLSRDFESPDRRRCQLRITPRGMELLALPRPTIESAVTSALRGIPPRKVEAAGRVLAAVTLSLETPSRTAGDEDDADAETQ